METSELLALLAVLISSGALGMSARASREFTGWGIERAAQHTDYKITNFGHESAFLHALEGPTNPQLYDAPALLRRNDSTEFHIEESIATEDRYVVVVWTDQSNSWSRHTIPLP